MPTPETDEVLAHIDAAVEPTPEQLEQIIARYIQLRMAQMQLIRSEIAASGGSMQDPSTIEDPMGLMDTIRAKSAELNEAFKADCRALLQEDQHTFYDACVADLDLTMPMGAPGDNGPALGDTASDFTLKTLDGQAVTLSDLRGKPVVIEFGSITCPIYRGKVDTMEQIREDYAGRVHFLFVYTREEHPTGGWRLDINDEAGIVYEQHETYEDRVAAAEHCVEVTGTDVLMALDSMDNAVTNAWSGAPNRGYILDEQGVVISKQYWIEPEMTRSTLERHFAADKPADQSEAAVSE